MKKLKKNVKGVTMVALVVTIIILLILAGIVITLAVGNNGLINKAKNATEKYKEATVNEQIQLGSLYNQLTSSDGDKNESISKDDLKEILEEIMKEGNKNPTGTIISYMGNTPPDGYLLCNGETYNISDYSNLAEQIKEQFGSYNYFGGDGTTTFAVPNMQNKFLKGSNTAGIAEDAGLPNITGAFQMFSWAQGNGSGAFSTSIGNPNVLATGSAASYNHDNANFNASRSSKIYGNSTTVTPENISVLYCVKF